MTLRSRHQAAKAQKLRFRALQHGAKASVRLLVVAVELGGLGRQEQGERWPVEQPVGPSRMGPGARGVTGRHGHKS